MKPKAAQPNTAIIFDFDGTIADSFAIVFLEVVQTVTKRPPLTSEEIEELRSSSMKAALKKLGIKPWQVPLFVMKGRREVGARMERIHAFDGMPDVLKDLASHHSVYILSTNSQENITAFLKKYQVSEYITRIYGDIGLAGKAKALKKLLATETLSPRDCVYVGDEIRDIEAAKKAGLRCIAVSWGYNNADALRLYEPDGMVDSPQDLLKAIDELKAWCVVFIT